MGRIDADRRLRCKRCGKVTLEPALLEAPSPFRPDDTLVGCPKCLQCDEGFAMLCDEPGCDREVSGGYPTGDNADAWGGYRQTCVSHWRGK